ncbi:MAG TPA: hypothetical protein VFM18_18845 [Methanosarcina sp.]|nr:hypothetical protein [Methanosarcina sp.]
MKKILILVALVGLAGCGDQYGHDTVHVETLEQAAPYCPKLGVKTASISEQTVCTQPGGKICNKFGWTASVTCDNGVTINLGLIKDGVPWQ